MQAFTAFLQALMSIFGLINKGTKSLEIVADQTMVGLAQSRNEASKKYQDFMANEGIPESEVKSIIDDIMNS